MLCISITAWIDLFCHITDNVVCAVCIKRHKREGMTASLAQGRQFSCFISNQQEERLSSFNQMVMRHMFSKLSRGE